MPDDKKIAFPQERGRRRRVGGELADLRARMLRARFERVTASNTSLTPDALPKRRIARWIVLVALFVALIASLA